VEKECRPEDALADAEQIMRSKQVHRLPVVDGANRLVGILSLSGLAEEAGREAGAKKQEVTFAEIGETLESVCRPRSSQEIAVARTTGLDSARANRWKNTA
jgi:CBS-domain-containing membrane protein